MSKQYFPSSRGVKIAVNDTEIGTQDRLNIVSGANVTLTGQDDAVGSEIDVTISASGGSGSASDIADFDESVDDRVNSLLVNSPSITKNYDDSNNQLTIAVSPNSSRQRIAILNNGVLIGERSQVNFTTSNGVQIAFLDNTALDRVDVSFSVVSNPYMEYVNVNSTGKTIDISDHGKTLVINAGCTITLPALTENIAINLRILTSDTVTIAASGGAARNPSTGNLVNQNGKNAYIQYDKAVSLWYITGGLS